MTFPGAPELLSPMVDEAVARGPLDGVASGGRTALPQRSVADRVRGATRRMVGERRDRAVAPGARRTSRQALVHAATHDPLTDLPNRSLLLAWLHERTAERPSAPALTTMFVDLDHFKAVNDTHGHLAGDAVLVEIAHRLTSAVRSGDIVSRVGGDEFVVGLAGPGEAAACALAHRLLESLRRPHRLGSRDVEVTASIGIAFSSSWPRATAESLLVDADAALYRSKRSGRDQLSTYDDEVRRAVTVRRGDETDLRGALARAEIFAHYQPIFDLRTGEPVAAEAFARWEQPGRGLVPPAVFVPVAEETGLVTSVDDAVLAAAVAAIAELDRALADGRSTLWVNVSSRQLESPQFARRLIERVEAGALVGRIGVEIVEAGTVRDVAARELALLQLQAAGLRIAVEELSTSHRSLARLADPGHSVKIDRLFLRDVGSSRASRLVAAIVELARAAGATTRAEGIETAEQLAWVRHLGVDQVSGFLLAPPGALDHLAVSVEAARRVLSAGS